MLFMIILTNDSAKICGIKVFARRMKMEHCKYVYERYCPNIGDNVIVEETVDNKGLINAVCCNQDKCIEESGGCQNEAFSSQQ